MKYSRSKKIEKVKCWEVFACKEKDCPAYKSKDLRCWLFSETHCRDEIQGKFIEKMEMCLGCEVFDANMDVTTLKDTIKTVDRQFKEFRKVVDDSNRELEGMSMELALGLSEVFEGLKKISSGDPEVKIPETSEVELITKLKHMVNMTAENIGEIVDQFHEFAIGLAEHFDVLHRVSIGDLNAKVTGGSQVELLESLKNVTNEMIESISREITERRKAEIALLESEEKYLDLYQNAPDGYHSIGPDGTILEVNDTWLRMFGYERDEIIGKKKLTDLLTADGVKIVQETFPQLKSKGSIENIEYEIKRKDGTFLPIVLNATAIYDENGNFLRTRSIIRDNSETKTYEKMLLHSAQEWRSTFDSMPYGVMLLDREFNIIRSNLYVSRLIGIPIEDMVMKKCYELMHGTDRPIEQCSLLRPEDLTNSVPFEYYEPRLNRHFMAYSTPIYTDGGPVKSYVHALVDITEIKNKEKELIISRNAFFNMLKDVDFSYAELKGLYNGLIYAFANAIDAKSKWTKGHSERVTDYAVAIAKEMGLSEKDIETLRIAALLHDVGKIGTYDVILDKPGRLNDEEWNLIGMHPVKGEEILRPIKQLQDILPIIRHHHERIDGEGYPDGLKGEEIPLLLRVIAVADSFDSMTSDRPYRPAPSREYAISELKKYSGIQFDPQVVEAFLRIL
jgi:PAS domain S-box-containing protein/putative nucleotidyltransferase with HDIG domain